MKLEKVLYHLRIGRKVSRKSWRGRSYCCVENGILTRRTTYDDGTIDAYPVLISTKLLFAKDWEVMK